MKKFLKEDRKNFYTRVKEIRELIIGLESDLIKYDDDRVLGLYYQIKRERRHFSELQMKLENFHEE